jgi:hypothetical protein
MYERCCNRAAAFALARSVSSAVVDVFIDGDCPSDAVSDHATIIE